AVHDIVWLAVPDPGGPVHDADVASADVLQLPLVDVLQSVDVVHDDGSLEVVTLSGSALDVTHRVLAPGHGVDLAPIRIWVVPRERDTSQRGQSVGME